MPAVMMAPVMMAPVMMVDMAWRIRPAHPRDSAAFEEIERSTYGQFRSVGLDIVANEPPDPVDVLDTYADAGRSWVACDDGDAPVGYVLAAEVDGSAHVAQVTVRAEWQGHGVGRALIERVVSWAHEHGFGAVTLTTFSDVSWNRPLYEHLGFRVLHDEEIGPELREIRHEETRKGYDPQARVAMRLDLDG